MAPKPGTPGSGVDPRSLDAPGPGISIDRADPRLTHNHVNPTLPTDVVLPDVTSRGGLTLTSRGGVTLTSTVIPGFQGPKLKDYLPFMKPKTFGKDSPGAKRMAGQGQISEGQISSLPASGPSSPVHVPDRGSSLPGSPSPYQLNQFLPSANIGQNPGSVSSQIQAMTTPGEALMIQPGVVPQSYPSPAPSPRQPSPALSPQPGAQGQGYMQYPTSQQHVQPTGGHGQVQGQLASSIRSQGQIPPNKPANAYPLNAVQGTTAQHLPDMMGNQQYFGNSEQQSGQYTTNLNSATNASSHQNIQPTNTQYGAGDHRQQVQSSSSTRMVQGQQSQTFPGIQGQYSQPTGQFPTHLSTGGPVPPSYSSAKQIIDNRQLQQQQNNMTNQSQILTSQFQHGQVDNQQQFNQTSQHQQFQTPQQYPGQQNHPQRVPPHNTTMQQLPDGNTGQPPYNSQGQNQSTQGMNQPQQNTTYNPTYQQNNAGQSTIQLGHSGNTGLGSQGQPYQTPQQQTQPQPQTVVVQSSLDQHNTKQPQHFPSQHPYVGQQNQNNLPTDYQHRMKGPQQQQHQQQPQSQQQHMAQGQQDQGQYNALTSQFQGQNPQTTHGNNLCQLQGQTYQYQQEKQREQLAPHQPQHVHGVQPQLQQQFSGQSQVPGQTTQQPMHQQHIQGQQPISQGQQQIQHGQQPVRSNLPVNQGQQPIQQQHMPGQQVRPNLSVNQGQQPFQGQTQQFPGQQQVRPSVTPNQGQQQFAAHLHTRPGLQQQQQPQQQGQQLPHVHQQQPQQQIMPHGYQQQSRSQPAEVPQVQQMPHTPHVKPLQGQPSQFQAGTQWQHGQHVLQGQQNQQIQQPQQWSQGQQPQQQQQHGQPQQPQQQVQQQHGQPQQPHQQVQQQHHQAQPQQPQHWPQGQGVQNQASRKDAQQIYYGSSTQGNSF